MITLQKNFDPITAFHEWWLHQVADQDRLILLEGLAVTSPKQPVLVTENIFHLVYWQNEKHGK